MAPTSDPSFIAEAFCVVAKCSFYRGKWITASEFARVISCEYCLPDVLAPKLLISALKKTHRNATDRLGHHDVDNHFTLFRKEYRPRGHSTIQNFFVTSDGQQNFGLPVAPEQHPWFFDIVPLSEVETSRPETNKCRISKKIQSKFCELIVEYTTKKPGAKATAQPKKEAPTQPPALPAHPATLTPSVNHLEEQESVAVSTMTDSSSSRQTQRSLPDLTPALLNYQHQHNTTARKRPTYCSPGSKAAMALRPRAGKDIATKRKAGQSSIWNISDGQQSNKSSKSTVSSTSSTTYRNVRDLETTFAAIAKQDHVEGATYLWSLINKKGNEKMLEEFMRLLDVSPRTNENLDTEVVERIKEFVHYHRTGGTRRTEAQQAVDSILTAAAFTADKSFKITPLADRLKVGWHALASSHKRAKTLIQMSQSYSHPKRKEREDCTRDDAKAAILEFCHSEEASNLDTNSFKYITVVNALTGVQEPHPLRVWHYLTVEEQLKTFLTSRAYQKFQEKNTGKTIGKHIFRDSVCNCVKLPGSDSCVDIYMSTVKYYMKALNIKEVHDLLESCECDAHTQQRYANTQEEELHQTSQSASTRTKVWDSYLSGRAEDLIQGSCCKAEEQPELCLEVGIGKPPKMIPWKCSHGLPTACTSCGVSELRMMDCEAVVASDSIVKVMEWKLAPRAGYNKNGEQNTQLEITEGKEKIKQF